MDFFTASKLFWTVAAPGNFLLLMLCTGFAISVTRYRRAGLSASGFATVALLIIAILPFGSWAIVPLENRFPRPAWPTRLAGVLVLGGGEDPNLFSTRGTAGVIFSEGRLVGALELSRRYPQARIVFTGYEADVAKAAFQQLGLEASRITFESQARNTWENLLFSRNLVQPKPGETWLLVTSSFHMPRAMGIARRVGWNMTAWPVDYFTGTGIGGGFSPSFQLADNLGAFELALREWVGLVVYRITDRSAAVFPAPASDEPD